jgi:hypothetical protein
VESLYGISQMTMSPIKLMVRCVAESKDGQWQAFSLEFGLAAQADSFSAAKKKLDDMIRSYLLDALVGEDRDHARELLSRKAPFRIFAKYYGAVLIGKMIGAARRSVDDKRPKAFGEPWPLVPGTCPI